MSRMRACNAFTRLSWLRPSRPRVRTTEAFVSFTPPPILVGFQSRGIIEPQLTIRSIPPAQPRGTLRGSVLAVVTSVVKRA